MVGAFCGDLFSYIRYVKFPHMASGNFRTILRKQIILIYYEGLMITLAMRGLLKFIWLSGQRVFTQTIVQT